MYCTIPDSDTQEGAAAMLCGTAKMRRDQEKQNICEKISHFSSTQLSYRQKKE